MTSKKCIRCETNKPLDEFYNCKANKDGKQGKCKECMYIMHKNWVNDNREKKQVYMKNWREENADHIKEYDKEHKELKIKQNKVWRENNKEHAKKYSAEYYLVNKEKIASRNLRWRENNPERVCAIGRRSSKNNCEQKMARNTKRRRNLGYIPLNKKFPGSVGHHIDREFVIHIPEELHKSIPHKQGDAESMYKINIKAREVLL